jgi:integrase
VQFESVVDQLMSKTDNISERAKQIIDDLLADKTKKEAEAERKFVEGMLAIQPNKDPSKIRFITFIDLNGNPVTIDTGDAEKDAETYKQIAPIETEKEQQRREKREEELHQAQLAAIAASGVVKSAYSNSKKVSEYLDDYIAYKRTPGKKGSWGAATARQQPKKLNVFRSVFGDKPAAALTRDDMERYIDIAYKIPSNFGNPDHKKFKGITLDMVLDNAPEVEAIDCAVRGAGTVMGDLKIISAFLNWALTRKDVSSLQPAINALNNEISDIDYESSKRAFTDDELKTLLQDNNAAQENYIKGFSSPFRFWLPLIALYTGARIAEIYQLHTSDIKLVKALSSDTEHWCIDINDDDGKKLKNKHSRRQIPIHQNLINAGLIDYASDLRANRETRLFPELGGFHENSAGQWFANYSDQAGVTDKITSFHSFRHNFCSYLSDRHVPEDLVIALSGHQYKSLAKSTYNRNKNRDVGKLAEVINSIDYDLAHPVFK